MSVTIELPSVEYTQDFIDSCEKIIADRDADELRMSKIQDNAAKNIHNNQLVYDDMEQKRYINNLHKEAMTDLINQAKEGLENT